MEAPAKKPERGVSLHEATCIESSGRADAASGPQRGNHRQDNNRPGQGRLPTHVDLRSPI